MNSGRQCGFRTTSIEKAIRWEDELLWYIDAAKTNKFRETNAYKTIANKVFEMFHQRPPFPDLSLQSSTSGMPNSKITAASVESAPTMPLPEVFPPTPMLIQCPVCISEFHRSEIPSDFHFSEHDWCAECFRECARRDIESGSIQIICGDRTCGKRLS